MYFALHRFVQGQVDGRLDGQILSIRDALRITPNGLLSLDPVANGPPFDRQHGGWYWKVTAPGVDLRSPALGSEDFTIAAPPPEYHPKPITLDGIGPGDEPLRVRAQRFRFEDRSVVITASAPRHALEGPLREAMTPVALTLGVLALALIGGVLLQVRLGLRPLSQLTEDLQRVRTGRAERIRRRAAKRSRASCRRTQYAPRPERAQSRKGPTPRRQSCARAQDAARDIGGHHG